MLSAWKTIMRTTILIFTALTLALACAKTNNQPVIKGKVVHRSCATVAVAVLDANYYSLGQANWLDQASKQTYHYVFTVANDCTFPAVIAEGQEFYFKVVKDDAEGTKCVECALYDYPPEKTQLIKVVN